jgi:hypothetical protein
LKYEDILKNEELGITESKLRRYKQYGLITTKIISRGKNAGVYAITPKKSLNAIKEAIQLSKKQHVENIKETIFILFVRGYPVSLKIMRKKLLNYFNEFIMKSVKEIVDSSQDQQFLKDEWSDYLKQTKLIPKPGRPTKENEMNLEQEVKRNVAQTYEFLPILHYFLDQSYNTSSFISLIDELQFREDQDFPIWLKHEYWEKVIKSSTTKDFKEIRLVCKFINRYIQVLRDHQNDFPRAKAAIEFLESNHWLERTRLIKLFMLLMLDSNLRKQALELLQSEETLSMWLELWKGGV